MQKCLQNNEKCHPISLFHGRKLNPLQPPLWRPNPSITICGSKSPLTQP